MEFAFVRMVTMAMIAVSVSSIYIIFSKATYYLHSTKCNCVKQDECKEALYRYFVVDAIDEMWV